jgi:Zn ribbon nucleic-acid-binding protein|tara:strand:+ start:122 stop:568 length:447 start_codon:yes stop_codon:yes gene_type:complete
MNIVSSCPLCGERALHVVGKNEAQIQQCISCGFTTTSLLKGSKETNEHYQKLGEDMKNWSVEENNHIWIPSMITLPFGMLYPFNDDKVMKWSLAEMIDIPEDERKNYPKETGDGYYDKRFDTDNAVVFDKFYLGLSELNNRAKKQNNG